MKKIINRKKPQMSTSRRDKGEGIRDKFRTLSFILSPFLSAFVSLCLIPNLSFAVFSNGWHNAGLLELRMSNYGTFGSENAGIWPRGSGEHYIFGAGVWVGGLKPGLVAVPLNVAVDSLATSLSVDTTGGFDPSRGFLRIGDELIYYRHTTAASFDSCIRGFAGAAPQPHSAGDSVHLILAQVSVGYDPSSGNSEFAPGDLPNEPGYTDTLDRIYFSDNPRDTALWPVRQPNGDALIVSNQDSYNVSNDLDASRHVAGGGPLGVKVIQEGYSWRYHYYEDFIFLTYLVINTSETDSLKDLFGGVCCDADIGDATDDLAGSDLTRDLGYAWDSNFSEPGWIHTPGYIGFDFLESPLGPSGQLGLTAYKILRNPGSPGQGVPDPANDLEAYLTLAGYDHPTGRYHSVDSLSTPTDVRFIQCTGPFSLAPLDTGRIVIAVIYGADSSDLRHNSDLAQNLYNAHYITHRAWVDDPNGHEEINGDYTIRWRDSSATGAPLSADLGCSHDRGRTWQDIITNIPSTGSYTWHTTAYPDGTRYLVRVTVYDTIAVGEDISDSCFTVNNPGNGAPDLEYISPQGGTVQGIGVIRWSADDPDHDTLAISLYLGLDTINWTPLATGLPNADTASWDSRGYHNGSYWLMVKAADRDTFTLARSGTTIDIVNDHPSAGRVEHVAGGCNSLSLQALEYDSTAYTGHTYQVGFAPIVRNPSVAEPWYRYTLRDQTGDTVLLADVGLDIRTDGNLYTQFSPIVDGFALQFDARIDRTGFRFRDFQQFRNRSGYDGNLIIHNEDSLGIAPPLSGYEWCFRGSDYVIRWKRDNPPDSLTLEVYDSTNHVYIPYGRDRGDCWSLGSGATAGRYFRRSVHKSFFLDGGVFWFNKNNEMTIPPDTGDVWTIRGIGHRVPCDGNVYVFTTPTGIAETRDRLITGLNQVYPNPSQGQALITFSLASKQRVQLVVFDIAGRKLRTLADEIRLPGRHVLTWDGTDDRRRPLSAGIYFIRLRSDRRTSERKLVLMR
jgi:hypothetical protein